MSDQGVNTYLLLLDPTSLEVVWANENVEGVCAERKQPPAVGRNLREVVPFAEALGLPELLHRVAESGEASHLRSVGFSVECEQTTTSASMYRLPSGDLLLASEYSVAGVLS